MPTWLKVVIAVAVMGVLAVVTLMVIGIFMLKENMSPEHAAKIASDIVDLPEPLPEGWQYAMGMDVGYQESFNLRSNKYPFPVVQFSRMLKRTNRSAKDLVDGFAVPAMAGMKFEPEGRGEETIGGRKAYYVRERCTVLGKQSALEIAMIDLPDGKLVQIQTTEHGCDTFDPKIVKPIFDAIKGFR
jgi:hypothetical protein